jgi:hypothetical protein
MSPTRSVAHALALTGLLAALAVACTTTPTTAPSAAVASMSPGPSTAASPSATSPLATPSAVSPSASTAAPASPTTEPSPTPAPTPTRAPTPEPTAAPPVEAFPQTWAGTWTDPVTGGAGSLELVLDGEGSAFGGSITMDGTACLVGGLLDGRYDGDEIVFTVTQRGVDLSFVGEASDAGLRGTFTSTCEGMDGTWEVQRSGR